MDLVIRGNLASLVALDEVDLTRYRKRKVVDPVVLFGDFIIHELEEQGLVRRARNQSCFIYHEHLSKASISDRLLVNFDINLTSVCGVALKLKYWHPERLALSVELVYFVVVIVVEAFVGKVLVIFG